MLKNAFKKHPLQNRTNVQIKGGGAKAFWTMFKKTALFWNDGFPKTDKFEPTSWEHSGKGSVAEVLTGVHTGLEVQVLAFVSSRWGKPTPAKFKVCPQVIILPFF